MTKWEEYHNYDFEISTKTELYRGALELHQEAYMEYLCFKDTKWAKEVKSLAAAVTTMNSVLEGGYFTDEVEMKISRKMDESIKEFFDKLTVNEEREVISSKATVFDMIKDKRKFAPFKYIDKEIWEFIKENDLQTTLNNMIDEIGEKNLNESEEIEAFVEATFKLAEGTAKWEKYKDLGGKIWDKVEDYDKGVLESYEGAYIEYYAFANTQETDKFKNLAAVSTQMFSYQTDDYVGARVDEEFDTQLLKFSKDIFEKLSFEEQDEVISRKKFIADTIEDKNEFKILLDIDKEIGKMVKDNDLWEKISGKFNIIDSKDLSMTNKINEMVETTMVVANELGKKDDGVSKIVEDILEKENKEKEKTR